MKLLKKLISKMDLDIEQDSTKLLILFICADLFFIILHIVYFFYDPRGIMESKWSIEKDGGLAEAYQYVKEFWIVLMFIWIALRSSRISLLSWATIFLYVLFDDMLTIHEIYGDKIASRFGFSSFLGLRPEDLGELTVFIFFGSILFFLIAFTYYKNRNIPIIKDFNKKLIYLLIFLTFFGMATDVLHSMSGSVLRFLDWPVSLKVITWFSLGLLEDGGEMIVMSLVFWYVFLKTVPLKDNRVANERN